MRVSENMSHLCVHKSQKFDFVNYVILGQKISWQLTRTSKTLECVFVQVQHQNQPHGAIVTRRELRSPLMVVYLPCRSVESSVLVAESPFPLPPSPSQDTDIPSR